uniref:uncharacterized protein LOC120884508 n=1 Tax=Ictidomys tridecemlineatus TaxID=43179 RepID=UPI001A9FB697|nr:uncharacterized protein LOC120884508 [Ictidomys tridecemlineatus]
MEMAGPPPPHRPLWLLAGVWPLPQPGLLKARPPGVVLCLPSVSGCSAAGRALPCPLWLAPQAEDFLDVTVSPLPGSPRDRQGPVCFSPCSEQGLTQFCLHPTDSPGASLPVPGQAVLWDLGTETIYIKSPACVCDQDAFLPASPPASPDAACQSLAQFSSAGGSGGHSGTTHAWVTPDTRLEEASQNNNWASMYLFSLFVVPGIEPRALTRAKPALLPPGPVTSPPSLEIEPSHSSRAQEVARLLPAEPEGLSPAPDLASVASCSLVAPASSSRGRSGGAEAAGRSPNQAWKQPALSQ